MGKTILKVTVIPLFAVLMVSVYGHGSLKTLVESIYKGYSKPLDHYLYSRTPFHDDLELQNLLALAEYKGGDPLVYFGSHSGVSHLPHALKVSKKMNTQVQIWAPITPDWLLNPLIWGRRDRISVYIDRFSERSRLSGWLLLRATKNMEKLPLPQNLWVGS